MKITILSLLFGLAAAPISALELHSRLPPLTISDPGELLIASDRTGFAAWSSAEIEDGRPALIFHMAARRSSEVTIAPLRDRLEAANYPENSFQSISIVNLDEALWGTTGLVISQMAKNKRQHPNASIIADNHGKGLSTWSLGEKSVAVILLGREGRVKYLKEGHHLTGKDIAQILHILESEIAEMTERPP